MILQTTHMENKVTVSLPCAISTEWTSHHQSNNLRVMKPNLGNPTGFVCITVGKWLRSSCEIQACRWYPMSPSLRRAQRWLLHSQQRRRLETEDVLTQALTGVQPSFRANAITDDPGTVVHPQNGNHQSDRIASMLLGT